MRVWIDQDLCTGDGLCVDHCHDVFTLLEDGIAKAAAGLTTFDEIIRQLPRLSRPRPIGELRRLLGVCE